MENLARQSHDLDALITIKKRDLSNSHSYLEIAKLYQQAGQHDQALEWAEQIISNAPTKPSAILLSFSFKKDGQCGNW